MHSKYFSVTCKRTLQLTCNNSVPFLCFHQPTIFFCNRHFEKQLAVAPSEIPKRKNNENKKNKESKIKTWQMEEKSIF